MKGASPVFIIAASVVLLAAMYFTYEFLTRGRCDPVFEQTAERLDMRFKAIKSEGEVVLGRETVQALSEGSQKVGLYLKTCCIAQQNGAMSGDQLQSCISGAVNYDAHIERVAASVTEAQVAKQQGATQEAQQSAEEAQRAAAAAVSTAQDLSERAPARPDRASSVGTTAAIAAPDRPPRAVALGAEQEPNDTILEANAAEIGAAIAAEIEPSGDSDFFKFQYQDAKQRRDIVDIRLDNRSTTLLPALRVFNQDKSVAIDWQSPNAPGADLQTSIPMPHGTSYYVQVASSYGRSAGKYMLTLVPRKAYDAYEPNDDAFTATPIKLGQSVEANIMDGGDTDWYRLAGIGDEKERPIVVHLENQSSTLQFTVRIYNADKGLAKDWEAANTPGADLEISFPALSSQVYFIQVGAHYGRSAGKYRLSTR